MPGGWGHAFRRLKIGRRRGLAWPLEDRAPRLVAHDHVAGVQSSAYRWDRGRWKDAGHRIVNLPEELGRHELQFRATDRRGRRSRTWSIPIRVNGRTPEAPRVVRERGGIGQGD